MSDNFGKEEIAELSNSEIAVTLKFIAVSTGCLDSARFILEACKRLTAPTAISDPKESE